jgi:hypothetical protein
MKFLQPTRIITNQFKTVMEHCEFTETFYLLVIMPMHVTRDVKTLLKKLGGLQSGLLSWPKISSFPGFHSPAAYGLHQVSPQAIA